MPQKNLFALTCFLISTLAAFSIFASSAQAYSLNQAIAQTMATHPDILSNKSNIQASRHDVREAKGGWYPSVDIEGGAGRERSDNPATRAAGEGSRTFSRTESEFIGSQLLFDGGNVTNTIRQRRALLGASKFQLAQAKELLGFAAADAYLNVMRTRRLVGIAKKDVITHRGILTKIRKRLKAGAGRKSEVELAESRLAQAQATLARRIGEARDAGDTFIRVVGMSAPRYMKTPHMPKILPVDLGAAQLAANQSNPTIAAAESQYEASRDAVGVARSSFFPRITFDMSASYDNNLDGVRGHNNDAMAMLRLTYNLFKGGSDKASVDAANARKMVALHDAQNIRREVNESVALAWNGLIAAQQRLPHLRVHSKQSYNVSQSYKKQFVLGQRTLFDLLNAQSEYFTADASYVSGQYDVKIQSYRLLASMGILNQVVFFADTHPGPHYDMAKVKSKTNFARNAKATKLANHSNSPVIQWLPNAKQLQITHTPMLVQASPDIVAPPMLSKSEREKQVAKDAKNHFLVMNKATIKPDNRYTIHLLAAHKKKTIDDFIQGHHLKKQSTIVHIKNNDKTWYVLLYGDYPTRQLARKAMKVLPQDLQKLKPYTISAKEVSEAIIKTALS